MNPQVLVKKLLVPLFICTYDKVNITFHYSIIMLAQFAALIVGWNDNGRVIIIVRFDNNIQNNHKNKN